MREPRDPYVEAEIREARGHANHIAPRPRACDWDKYAGWTPTSMHRSTAARESVRTDRHNTRGA